MQPLKINRCYQGRARQGYKKKLGGTFNKKKNRVNRWDVEAFKGEFSLQIEFDRKKRK